MEFKSKFNIGETIHFMSGKSPVSQEIKGINIFFGERKVDERFRASYQKTKENEYSVEYYIEENAKPLSEKDVFASREELKKSVFPD